MEMSIFIILFYMASFVRQVQSSDIDYKIQEEVRLDTVVGNLYKNAFLFNNQNSQLTILNTNDKFVKCFKIDSQGQLIVARRIDRDQMCEKSTMQPVQKYHTYTEEECKIVLDIASPLINMITRVVVIIEDINDNAPSWNQLRVGIKFIDGCKERTKVALPPAYDNDIGQNGQIEYSFKEKDLPFRIDTEDGFYLQTLQSLDREQKASYLFTLIASDKGHPVLSGEIEVFVTIEDINDNSPIFSKQLYRFKSLSEDSPIGTVVGKLEATDTDSGINGKFNFKFAETTSDIIKHYFQIQADGTVTVIAPLDVDRGNNELKFKVIVEDEALRPYSRSSDATVIIHIDDINDEKPELKLIFLNLDPRSNKPFVVEHTKIGTLIGILEVTDRDFKNSDTVLCTMDNSQFSLISEDNRPLKYKIVTNMDFDREKVVSGDLRIVCRDTVGNIVSSNHSISVKDINDNPPNFTKSFYVLKIRENMPINTPLSEKLFATDPDSESNIQYFILPEHSANFSIDRETGIITTKVSFNREACSTYTIKVIAKDSIRDVINTGTCTVQIQILDENDNKPTFSLEYYTFHIMENNAINTVVGTVEATDLDTPDSKNALTYRLDHQPTTRHFKINSHSGVISAMTSLDREKMTHYIFSVYVEDGYEYSLLRHTATSTVTIIVDDLNDNAPKFVNPNATKSSFDVSIKESAGHKITDIYAIDDDYADNAKINYNITSGNDLHIFNVDPSNGLLFLAGTLQSFKNKPTHYILTVMACDFGKPKQLCTSFTNLRIVVYNGDEYGNKNLEINQEPDRKDRTSNVHNEVIVVCLAIVFVTLLLSASALICLIKCNPGIWYRSSTRTSSKDKRFETGVNSQMLPTIDANMKDKEIEETMRNFYTENQTWLVQSDPTKIKSNKCGYAVDHTNRTEYQTLESLCLATTMRNTPQPRFIDPCTRLQPQTSFSHSTSFLSNQDIKITNQLGSYPQPNEALIHDTSVYQFIDEGNPVNFYSKLQETKKSGKYNHNDSNIDPNSATNNNNNNINKYNNNIINPKDNDLSKYATYSFNESSFV